MELFLHSQQTFSQTKYHTNPWFPTSSETWHTSCTAVVTNHTLHLTCYTIRIYSPNPVSPLGHSPPNLCSTIRNINLIFCIVIRERLWKQFSNTLNREVILRMLFPQPKLPGSPDSLCYVSSLPIAGGTLRT